MGVASAAITSLKNNHSLRKRKNKPFKTGQSKQAGSKQPVRTPIVLNKKKVERLKKRQLMFQLTVLILIFLATGIVLYFLL